MASSSLSNPRRDHHNCAAAAFRLTGRGRASQPHPALITTALPRGSEPLPQPTGYGPGMLQQPPWKRGLEGILSIGATPEESESRRGGRRVFMLAFILASLFTVPA